MCCNDALLCNIAWIFSTFSCLKVMLGGFVLSGGAADSILWEAAAGVECCFVLSERCLFRCCVTRFFGQFSFHVLQERLEHFFSKKTSSLYRFVCQDVRFFSHIHPIWLQDCAPVVDGVFWSYVVLCHFLQVQMVGPKSSSFTEPREVPQQRNDQKPNL